MDGGRHVTSLPGFAASPSLLMLQGAGMGVKKAPGLNPTSTAYLLCEPRQFCSFEPRLSPL